ncbi:LpqB family beta-propeller domain-containing protein [Catellatospora chokoriensis]|nr:LpqB family beta-propeller domain-containing protein [Catellatospora chokoriensis]
MRRTMSALLAAATAVALAGCGIGVRDDVVRDGLGPSAGPELTSPDGVKPPPWTRDVTEPTDLVANFLLAAAGDHGGAHETIMATAEQYIAPDERAEWNPGSNVVLVEVGSMTREGDKVDVPVRRLGVLTPEGQVLPYDGKERGLYTFKYGRAAGGGLVLTDLPQELLLNVDQLETYYLRLPIYFWNTDNTSLVPDLRYLPRAVPQEQVNNRLFDWLVKGPSAWLSDAVERLPDDAGRRGSIVENANQITVNLGALADAAVRDRLAAQLYWTLWPEGEQRLQLQLEGRDVTTDYQFPDKNLAASLSSAREPNRYAVVDGVLTRVVRKGEAHPPPLQDVLPAAVNSELVSAAVAKDETAFALVRRSGKGKQELYIGPRSAPRDKSTTNDTAAKPTIHSAGLTGDSISRPIWLDRAGTTALVLHDGKLSVVLVHGTRPTSVDTTEAAFGKITGVTVAPDGRRMALVIGGDLYVAPLLRSKAKQNAFKVGKPRKLATSLAGRLREVAFLREDTVVVSTSGDVATLAYVTVDGAIEVTYPTGQKAALTNLTAYVGNAGRTVTSGNVLLDVDNEATKAYIGTLDPLIKESLLLLPPPPSPSPSPSSSGPPQPPVEPTVTAACFEG